MILTSIRVLKRIFNVQWKKCFLLGCCMLVFFIFYQPYHTMMQSFDILSTLVLWQNSICIMCIARSFFVNRNTVLKNKSPSIIAIIVCVFINQIRNSECQKSLQYVYKVQIVTHCFLQCELVFCILLSHNLSTKFWKSNETIFNYELNSNKVSNTQNFLKSECLLSYS